MTDSLKTNPLAARSALAYRCAGGNFLSNEGTGRGTKGSIIKFVRKKFQKTPTPTNTTIQHQHKITSCIPTKLNTLSTTTAAT